MAPARRFDVKLEGLERASRLPGWLATGQRDFLRASVGRLAREVAAKAPGGPGGRIGRTIDSQVLTSTTGRVFSGHPGARALDRGAYITAKKGKVLRFNVEGKTVFTRTVRIAPRRFFAKGLRNRNRIVQAAFDEHLGNLG